MFKELVEQYLFLMEDLTLDKYPEALVAQKIKAQRANDWKKNGVRVQTPLQKMLLNYKANYEYAKLNLKKTMTPIQSSIYNKILQHSEEIKVGASIIEQLFNIEGISQALESLPRKKDV
jgi:hypothetical protein